MMAKFVDIRIEFSGEKEPGDDEIFYTLKSVEMIKNTFSEPVRESIAEYLAQDNKTFIDLPNAIVYTIGDNLKVDL